MYHVSREFMCTFDENENCDENVHAALPGCNEKETSNS